MYFRILALAIALLSPLAFAGGKIMKPMPGPGTGELVDDLRASISMVKGSFGPGESIVVVWKLTNESDQIKSVAMYKGLTGNYDVEIRQNGKTFRSVTVRFDDAGEKLSIQPGDSITRMIDLLQMSFEDKSWREMQGSFDVVVTLATMRISSGTASFKITAPGENKAPIDPELAEKIRTLITQLGHNEFAVREKAYADLRAIGKPALGMLDEVANANGDLEVVSRCKKLIEEIRRGNIKPPPFSNNPIPQPIPAPPPIQIQPVPKPVPQPAPVNPLPVPQPPGVKPPRPPVDLEF